MQHLRITLLTIFLFGCGGGGSGEKLIVPQVSIDWEAGIYPESSLLKSACENPRSGDEFDDRSGSTMHEKMWLRSYSDETYLWYDEIPDQDPSPYSVLGYFDQLVTTGLTPSGQNKDRFHFTYDTAAWEALSQSGVSSGYGMQLAIDGRSVRILYTEPDSPATSPSANLSRGAHILAVDGIDIASASSTAQINAINAGLFPSAAGLSHSFTVRDAGATVERELTLVSEAVVSSPVQHVKVFDVAGTATGYMLFNDHIATAESALADAISFFAAQSVEELVIDLRYNGGGYLDIASALAFMVAGEEQTSGKTFELLQFNDKHPTFNPITGQRLEPQGFESAASGDFSLPSGVAFPSVNLSRLFVLTGPNTCSASESVINSLRGIDVELIQIGSTTCGKPYGFYATDNCGTTYFTIQFRGVNAKGFGDYSDGFSPSSSVSLVETEIPGCEVADDLENELGNALEGRLAAALHYIEHGSCPDASMPKPSLLKSGAEIDVEPVMLNLPPWRQNRLM